MLACTELDKQMKIFDIYIHTSTLNGQTNEENIPIAQIKNKQIYGVCLPNININIDVYVVYILSTRGDLLYYGTSIF